MSTESESRNQQNLVNRSTPSTADEVSWPLKRCLYKIQVSDDKGVIPYDSSSGNGPITILLPAALSLSSW